MTIVLLIAILAVCDAQKMVIRRKWWRITTFDKRDVGTPTVECLLGKSSLKCSNVVDCAFEVTLPKALNDFRTRFNSFGIGKGVEGYYDLFPETQVKSVWLNSTISSGHHLAVYHVPRENFVGFRILDKECWKNVTTHFNSVTKFDRVAISKASNNVPFLGYIHFN